MVWSKQAADLEGNAPSLPKRMGYAFRTTAVSLSLLSRAVPVCLAILVAVPAQAGDILRGGASAAKAKSNASARSSSGAEAAAERKKTAQDRLARTSQVINSLRNANVSASGSSIPNGLVAGGLVVANPADWIGANLPIQSGSKITIVQTAATAQLFWESFNIGRGITLDFDQSSAGSDIGKWIAFNRVVGSGSSRIGGILTAGGQVYVENPNGIRFEAGSKVSARTFVATTLPINNNLIARGVVNLEAQNAEFLFSATGQNNYTPPGNIYGDIQVDAGAYLQASVNSEGSGGRIMLVGANVKNAGTLASPSGQIILAAGLEVGVYPHAKNYPQIPGRITDDSSDDDASLRGLDTFIGEVGSYAGTVINTGLIDIPTGSVTMAGKRIEQRGGIDSTSTVSLNGRIDLLAAYGAVPNADFNAQTSTILPFLNALSGTVVMGPSSVSRILPDFAQGLTTVGSGLPIASQANILGQSISFERDATLLVTSGDIAVAAGNWGRITTNADGTKSRTADDFVFTGGKVMLAEGALIDASGSAAVSVPLEHSILTVQLRGNELAVSPLQRTGDLRGISLVIDIRRTGTYNGSRWYGTPLGDTSGFLDIIEKNALQLTASAGSVLLKAGGSVVMESGATIDVSGGYYINEGGRVQTTRLRYGRYIVDIADATPDRIYDGIYDGTTQKVSSKWGITKSFAQPLAPLGSYNQQSYISGADGGRLDISAPQIVLGGDVSGTTISGPRQLRKSDISSELASQATLRLAFTGEIEAVNASGVTDYYTSSPSPPNIVLGEDISSSGANVFNASSAQPASDASQSFAIPSDFYQTTGFNNLVIENSEGSIYLAKDTEWHLPVGATLSATARNIDLLGSIIAPGGRLSFTAYNLPRYEVAIEQLTPGEAPVAESGYGIVRLGARSVLDVSGLIVDDRPTASSDLGALPYSIDGGEIELIGYSVILPKGSRLDASGGLAVSASGDYKYGEGGSIEVSAGNDPEYPSILGGQLELLADLRGYSGSIGATLSIKAPLIQIGGSPLHRDSLVLTPEFFNTGGFSRFNLTGIGVAGGGSGSDPDAPPPFIPAVFVAPDVTLQPQAQSFAYVPFPGRGQQAGLRPVLRPAGLRTPVSLGLYSETIRNDFADLSLGAYGGVGDIVVVRGDILISRGAEILLDAGADLEIQGSTVEIGGTLSAPGGTVSIIGDSEFPLSAQDASASPFARSTVFLEPSSRISAAGAFVPLPDPFGRRQGLLYDGGSVSIEGNIVASQGAVIDVSGTSAALDVHPSRLAVSGEILVPSNSGLNSKPYSLRTVPYAADTDGGTIELKGSQFLFVDAALLGFAGGDTATGGTLSVSSGRFYTGGTEDDQYGSDINLVVKQSGLTLPTRQSEVGRPVRDAAGALVPGMGYFSADLFAAGGFSSLNLGVDAGASIYARGGNVEFRGPANISGTGQLRIATGGIIRADSNVNLSFPYIYVGQNFREPVNPDEPAYFLFEQNVANIYGQESVVPTSGTGKISFDASLIDIGTLVLKNIASADFYSAGDIRGNGVLSVAGTIKLAAAQIYPTTLAEFEIIAYDSASGPGTINVEKTGLPGTALSAGGTISLYASVIHHSGVLRAPFGVINIGWDGTDLDMGDSDIDQPIDPVSNLAVPKAEVVTLAAGSLTSVSGAGMLVPFGMSADGTTLLDPSGVEINSNGLPEKKISVSGESVVTENGSVIDLRGGGDLLVYRWEPGTGGAVDLLGETVEEWSGAATYEAGDLVLDSKGQTWSARVKIVPTDFSSGNGPSTGYNRYWTLVEDSYAIVPSYSAAFAPYGAFNTTSYATNLDSDPGYLGRGLKVGDTIHLDAGSGLPEGDYVLLPRRYAVLPGAYLVTPQESQSFGVFSIPGDSVFIADAILGSGRQVLPFGSYSDQEGAAYVTGYRYNTLERKSGIAQLRSMFEISSPEVIADRAKYSLYWLNEYFLSLEDAPDFELPADSGYLSLQANSSMTLEGSVLSKSTSGGKGSRIDIASFSDIYILGESQTAPLGAISLSASILSSFGADSLVIGGLRRSTSEGTVVDLRTNRIVVDNVGNSLSGADIALLSGEEIVLADGASIRGGGAATRAAETFIVRGDGVVVRASGSGGNILREDFTASVIPSLSVGAGVSVGGDSVVLDSTYAFSLDSSAEVRAENLFFGAGQISIIFDGTPAMEGELIAPHLVISGVFLQDVQHAATLSLAAYQESLDLYGSGVFGGPGLDALSISAGEIRGFGQGAGEIAFLADVIELSKTGSSSVPGAIRAPEGSLRFEGDIVRIAAGDLEISQFENVYLKAGSALDFSGEGSLSTDANVTAYTPRVVAQSGADQGIFAGGSIEILSDGSRSNYGGGIGGKLELSGTSARITADVILPSGSLTVTATGPGGDVTIGGLVDLTGTESLFYESAEYTSGGVLSLNSLSGDVDLLPGSVVSVAGHARAGSAGTVAVSAPEGEFTAAGIFRGGAVSGEESGSFILDTREISSFETLRQILETGGFFEKRDIRVRTGSLVVSGVNTARDFLLAADAGSITIDSTAFIDASGTTGGSISLAAWGDLVLEGGAVLTVEGDEFSSDGKGGSVYLEAGASTTGSYGSGSVKILDQSEIRLGVGEYKAGTGTGDYRDPTSSAFEGNFQGTLHIRAPRLGSNDVAVDTIYGTISGASSILVEGYKIYDLTASGGIMTGVISGAVDTTREIVNNDAANYINAFEAANANKLFGGTVNAALEPLLVVAPGVEIINTNGDLVLGTANTSGSTNAEALSSGDWDLSTFRYGQKRAPGILTLRASGNIYFNNTLSDGFTAVTASAANGHSTMWMALQQEIELKADSSLYRPVNLQSWSFRITAGADLSAASYGATLPAGSGGSIYVGELYAAVPNSSSSGSNQALGDDGLTANSIRISSGSTNTGTRYEVIRTGTGSISIHAADEVQLRNQFATIYTAGTRVTNPQNLYGTGDFDQVLIPLTSVPSQGALSKIQQVYGPLITIGGQPYRTAQYAMSGGDITIVAGSDISRKTLVNGQIVDDSSRQLPNNWLNRRAYVEDGIFAGITISGTNVNEAASPTTWWIDYSNFFEGVGTLGGGDIYIESGGSVKNIDAVAPTNARSTSRDGNGNIIGPEDSLVLELGGGDITVIAKENIDGGVYYIERGNGLLNAGGEIKTNETRAPTFGYLQGSTLAESDEATYLPTTLFVGKGNFDVVANGDVLLGPTLNTFWLPQGATNRFWYKTYFNTYAETSSVNVQSLNGDVTFRLAVLSSGGAIVSPVENWLATQNAYSLVGSTPSPSAIVSSAYYQPWIRLAETSVNEFSTVTAVLPPVVSATAYSGNILIAGDMNVYPSSVGTLDLLAGGSVYGLNPIGEDGALTAYTYSTINVSDANPSTLLPVTSPLGYLGVTSSSGPSASGSGFLEAVRLAFDETGSFSGSDASASRKQLLHDSGILHLTDIEPLRIYARSGDISGFTLFSPKASQIAAGGDIADISFYLQNANAESITIVSAGGDITPYNDSAALRASILKGDNYIVDPTGASLVASALLGDIQIGGSGVLEVLAGGSIDLGESDRLSDGTGAGITSIGRSRNPFLPFDGSQIFVLAGVSGEGETAALGLTRSSLVLDGFMDSTGSDDLGITGDTEEHAALRGLLGLFALLKNSAIEAQKTGDYTAAYAAIAEVFGESSGGGDIYTRTRDIRTVSGGGITIAAPGGGMTMAPTLTKTSLTPPGIVTEYGGEINILLDGDLDIGATRIFTLKGGDLTIWSSRGDIAAGTAAKTVVTAPPTRVSIDATSAELETDLGGLATGGGIGVLASVPGVEPGTVTLLAPAGTVDAGDAGIRATGDITIAAAAVVNADNISAGGTSTGVPSAPVVAAPNIAGLSSASTSTGATTAAADNVAQQARPTPTPEEETQSIFEVEVLGYGGGE